MKIHCYRERLVPVCSIAWLVGFCLLFGACAAPEVGHNNAGNEHFSKGAYDQALEEYRLAQLADPGLAVPYFNAANSHNRKSQLSAVVGLTAQALRTAEPSLAANAWYNLGNAFFDAEKWPEAIEAYREALRITPDDGDAKHNLELALLRFDALQQSDKIQEEQNHSSNDARPSGADTPTPDPGSAQDPSQDRNQFTPEPGEERHIPAGMSREQAEQLLEALLGSGETLQKQLRKVYPTQDTQPEKDW